MRSFRQREYLAQLLMQASSLNELLGILKGITERLRLNKRQTHLALYRQLQFIYFGLMVKSDGLLKRMQLRCDTLSTELPEFKIVVADLRAVRKALSFAYQSTQKGDLLAACKEIIEVADTYEPVYARIQTAAFNELARK